MMCHVDQVGKSTPRANRLENPLHGRISGIFDVAVRQRFPFGNSGGVITRHFATYDRQVPQPRHEDRFLADFEMTFPADFLTENPDGLRLIDSRNMTQKFSQESFSRHVDLKFQRCVPFRRFRTLFQRGCIMSQFASSIKRFIVSEDGPTAVEYAVMLALIIVVCLTAIQAVGTNASATFTNVSTKLGGS